MTAFEPLDLSWQGDLRFQGQVGETTLTMDSGSKAGPSPVQALAFALAGCMGMDLVHILSKARLAPVSLSIRISAERAPTEPKRFVSLSLHFALRGDVPEDRVARALELSRQTYCSVWHSMRQDIEFKTSFEVTGS